MNVALEESQLGFLESEFGITQEEVKQMDKEDWNAVREKCFDVEVDELMTNGEDCETERYILAASIIDAK